MTGRVFLHQQAKKKKRHTLPFKIPMRFGLFCQARVSCRRFVFFSRKPNRTTVFRIFYSGETATCVGRSMVLGPVASETIRDNQSFPKTPKVEGTIRE